MRSIRGSTITPVVTGIAFLAAIAGGVRFGQRHPYYRVGAVRTHGEWVKYANAKGDSVRAYVAYPERKDKAPAIIIVHEIYGMTDWEPTVADRFAGNGYVAIVPDLLSSQYKSTDSVRTRATQLVSALPDSQVVGDLNATYKYVNSLAATQRGNTGIIGFCWGGGTVWKYAAANPDLKAGVACYGPVTDTTMLHTVKAPMFGIYAEGDARVTGMLPGIKAAMDNNHKNFTSSIYTGAGHGFLKPGRTGYGTPEYDRALRDIDAFFAKQLEHK
ncbi:MAG TPA: dienelactone hydrolase family protein [Gemmatimonadales bacterium]|jgi:carboxymethylenebutenolidase